MVDFSSGLKPVPLLPIEKLMTTLVGFPGEEVQEKLQLLTATFEPVKLAEFELIFPSAVLQTKSINWLFKSVTLIVVELGQLTEREFKIIPCITERA